MMVPRPGGIAIVLTAVFSLMCPGFSRSFQIGPRRALDRSDLFARGALEKIIVVARIVDAVEPLEAARRSLNDRVGQYFVIEPELVLKGPDLPHRFQAWFSDMEGSSPPQLEIPGYRGKTAILFPRQYNGRWMLNYEYFLPEEGLQVVSGVSDPLVEEMRCAIRRTRIDSLSARAEVICVARMFPWRLPPVHPTRPELARYRDSVEVVQWVAGPGRSDRIEVFRPWFNPHEGEYRLLFLARNSLGKLEPLGMGAGEFEIANGVVTRLGQPLDGVLRLVRIHRFLHDASSSATRAGPRPGVGRSPTH